MELPERLDPVMVSKEFDQSDRLLKKVWVERRDDENGPLDALSGIEILVEFLQMATQSQHNVLRIILSQIDEDVIRKISRLVEYDKRVYMVVRSDYLEENLEILRSLGGWVLIRGVNQTLPGMVVVGDGISGLCEISPELFIELDEKQSREAALWFNWFFWKKAEIEISSPEEIDKPKTILSSPYEPLFPSLNSNLSFSVDTNLPESIVETYVCSSQEILSRIQNGERLILNGIDLFNYENMYFRRIEGTRDSNISPDVIVGKDNLRIIETYWDPTLVINGNKNQTKIVNNLIENYSSPYRLEDNVVLGTLNKGTWIKTGGTWLTILKNMEQELNPIEVDEMMILKDMEVIEPREYPDRPPNVKHMRYRWKVVPPRLPKGAKDHRLNREWEEYKGKCQELILDYMKKVKAVKSKSGSMTKVLNFIRRKLTKNQSEAQDLEDWLKRLSKLSWTELREETRLRHEELEEVMGNIDKLWDRQESEIRAEERRIEEEKQRKEYEERRKKMQDEKKGLEKELEKVDKKDKDKIKKLKKQIEKLEGKIRNNFKFKLKTSIRDKKSRKEKRSVLSYFKSGKGQRLLPIPEKPLPRSGVLFTHTKKDYLCVHDWGSVPDALDEAKRYWNAKVVSAP